MTAKTFTKIFLFLIFSVIHVRVHAWEVDLSRRQNQMQRSMGRAPATAELVPLGMNSEVPTDVLGKTSMRPIQVQDEKPNILGKVFQEMTSPSQTIVILNTANGFVPNKIHLKKGMSYNLHIVNVNEAEKNVSFILDAFSEHHATYFGKEKKIEISPKTEGIFSFQCPETAVQGQLIVYSDSINGDLRLPASAE